MEYITWANEARELDGKWKEHVSFQSFVRRFGFGSKEEAMAQYERLLSSSRLHRGRRERLKAEYDDFRKARLETFWWSWDRKQANLEFDASCDTVVKRTAILAQKSSLAASAQGFSAVETRCGIPTNARTDNGIPEGAENVSNLSTDSENPCLESAPPASTQIPPAISVNETGLSSDMNHEDQDEGVGSDADNESGEGAQEEESEDDAEEGRYTDQEAAELFARIAKTNHFRCEWKVDTVCVACRFQDYQKACVEALSKNSLRKSQIADTLALLGVFAPFLSTPRMKRVFGQKLLTRLSPSPSLPEIDIDDAAVVNAVRLRLSDKRDDACDTLRCLDRKLRIMFENLFELLPAKSDRKISETTFTANYIAPILNAILKADDLVTVHFPNTESRVQKDQGIKPHRPDIMVKASDHEILYGEITGPAQMNHIAKNNWDLFRLARFGKAFLDKGHVTIPLLQVVYDCGSVMRLSMKERGMYLLEEAGQFTVPCTLATIPSLLTTLPALLALQEDVQKLADSDLDYNRKRSWGYGDIQNAKKRICKK